MCTTSIQGYRYFISFLDDHTSLGCAYYLKHKSDSIQAFEDFKAWAENVTGNRIIVIRWQLAVDAAVHIYNCQPMRRLKWQCPITL